MRPIKISLLIFLVFYSCEHITEEYDITKEIIDLELPVNQSSLENNNVIFSWEKNATISFFRFQVASPDFDSSNLFLIDTLVATNLYRDTLFYNRNYEWRVRGENSIFNTAFSSRSFFIRSEDNISDQNIILYSPQEGISIAEEKVYFSWEPQKMASQYRLQIASPSFKLAQQIIIDTLVTNSTFLINTLPQNRSYEWRVRGENENFNTPYTSFSFNYLIAPDISKLKPEIIAPKDTLVWQENNTRFSWKDVSGASGYRFQIALPDFDNTNQFILDTLVKGLHFENKLPLYKKLQWRIRAENDSYHTKYVTQNLRAIDAPDISSKRVRLIAPHNNATLSTSSFKLAWEKIDGATTYQVQVAYPKFSRPIEIIVDETVENLNLSVTLKDGLSYQWRVRGINKQTQTPYSSPWNFTLNKN